MKSILHISSPYTIQHKYETWLCADFIIGEKKNTIYFAVESQFAEYFCLERSDPFLVLALTCAMTNDFNIQCDAPVTDTLYFNLSRYLIPTVSRFKEGRCEIEISCHTASAPENAGGVACGFSGGVDSWYTALKNLEPGGDKFRLTHLMMHNGGVQPFDDEKNQMLKGIAAELGLIPLYIRSNYYSSMYPLIRSSCDTLDWLAYPFVLRKLFRVFNFSSDIPINIFSADSLLPSLLSSEDLMIYYSGMETLGRIEKVDYIIKHKLSSIVMKNIRVCNSVSHERFTGSKNCVRCQKCIRTLFEMYALGMLKYAGACFNVNLFEKNISLLWHKLYSDVHEREWFIPEIEKQAEKNGISLPKGTDAAERLRNIMPAVYNDLDVQIINPEYRDQRDALFQFLLKEKRFNDIDEIFRYEKILDPGWAFFMYSRKEWHMGNMDKAIFLARKALHHEPYATKHRAHLANLLLESGKHDEALTLIKDGIAEDKLWAQGYILLAELDPDSEAEIMRSATTAIPHNLALWTWAAQRPFEKGLLDDAVMVLEKALEYNPDWKKGHLILAELYETMGNADKALRVLEKTEKFHPDVRPQMFRLLCLHGSKGDALDFGQEKLGWTPMHANMNRSRIILETRDSDPDAFETARESFFKVSSD